MEKGERNRSNSSKQPALKKFFIGSQKEDNGIKHKDDAKVRISENESSLPLPTSTDHGKINNSSPSRASPDPSCAICLGQLENKSFTDSCFHTFCFTCLLEWSKVKPECPLCKQHFESIVYNVRSIEDYDQYHVSKNRESSWRSPDGQRFRYSSTLTTDRLADRRRRAAFENSQEYIYHRSTYAPHSVSSQSSRAFISEYPTTSSFRRRIYENGLWVKPLGNGDTRRFRCSSPEFFRQNTACTHRLTPWLNRELLALLHDSESQVIFVLELILALIMRYDIRSQEFYVHIQPYLQDRTSHFIHEFYNYASSPFDMTNYDNRAAYERLESFVDNSAGITSSPGSDVVALPTPDNSVPHSSSTSLTIRFSSSKKHNKRKNKTPYRSSTKLFLRRNQENDLWQSVSPSSSQHTSHGSSSINSALVHFSTIRQECEEIITRPSTSGTKKSKNGSKKPALIEKSSLLSTDSDDCIIIDVIKPKALRTPEVVSLISSSDEEGTYSLISQDDSPLRANGAPEKRESVESLSNADTLLGKDNTHESSKCDVKNYSMSHENCIPSWPSTSKENFEKIDFKETAETASSSISSVKSHQFPSTHMSRSCSKSSTDSRSRSKEKKSSSQSPKSKSKGKEKYHKNKYHYSSDTTDSSTESSLSNENFQSRGLHINETKVKLKSVVWRFSSTESQGSRNDYSYHGKKHKHKKKKKHGKHKRHKHSRSMNSE